MSVFDGRTIIFALAYPLTDEAVRNYFQISPSAASEAKCKKHLRSFLSSLFTSAHHLAEQLFPATKYKYKDLVGAFYKFFADPLQRKSFYEVVVKNAPSGLDEDPWKAFKCLHKYLKDHCADWPSAICPFLILIDEVHTLYTPRELDIGSDYTLYSRLKSVLYEGVRYPLAVISLSTAIHVPGVAPSKEVTPSLREKEDGRILPAPFTELPFDAHIIAEPLAPSQATLTSVGSLEFTAKFGRPL